MSINDRSEDHYATLGVTNTASSEDIKKAYRNLALQCHPDKATDCVNRQVDGCIEKFLKVQESYRVLIDQQSRRNYDASHREAALLQTFVVNEVITVEEMIFDVDDLTYRMSCRCGGEYVIDEADVCVMSNIQDVCCDTCSLTVKLQQPQTSKNTLLQAEQIEKEKSTHLSGCKT